VPTLSSYQMVAPVEADMMKDYHIVHCVANSTSPKMGVLLRTDGTLKLSFDEFDQNVVQSLARGVRNFSIGLSYTGANVFTPAPFQITVDQEGQTGQTQVWICPVSPDGNDDMQARARFRQYLSQIYSHLEVRGWTQYFYLYGADEPSDAQWDAPLTEYFAMIREIAPKLRIMITYAPTDRFGPNVNIACIMMNHLDLDRCATAEVLNQELWCYSAGDANNPPLTIPHDALPVRLWFWLQEKWGVERVLLWHTAWNIDMAAGITPPSSTQPGDGILFWRSRYVTTDWYPSIRAEMLRDGIEDREYIDKLKALVSDRETNTVTCNVSLVRGDADGDGEISSTDLSTVLRNRGLAGN
jgi:hypothetical protein